MIPPLAARPSCTLISASWTKKQWDSVVHVDAVAVGIACSNAHIHGHLLGWLDSRVGGVAGHHSVAVGGGIDSAAAVVVAAAVAAAGHRNNQPGYCFLW